MTFLYKKIPMPKHLPCNSMKNTSTLIDIKCCHEPEGKCKGGNLISGICICPPDRFLENEKCVNGKDICKDGKLINGRSIFPLDLY